METNSHISSLEIGSSLEDEIVTKKSSNESSILFILFSFLGIQRPTSEYLTESNQSSQYDEHELIKMDEPIPEDSPGGLTLEQVSIIGDWESVFVQVEDTVADVKQKEMSTWTGKIYENIRRRAEHADPDKVDLANFFKHRLGKYIRKVLRCFDFIPVPISAPADEVDGAEGGWVSAWAVRDQQGGISVAHLIAWANQLEKKEAVSLETENGIDQHTFIRILQNHAKKDERYITKEEFHDMMKHYLNNTEFAEMTHIKKLWEAIAYAEEFRWWPPPFFTIFIILLEIFVFLYHFIFLTYWYGDYFSTTFPTGGPLAVCSQWLYHPHRKWEWWRFLTYGLVHSGPIHLITNLIVLSFVGLPLELTNKWWRVAPIYSFGILAGSLTVSILDSFAPLVGASGGIYALLGAHAANLVLNWKEDNLILQQVFTKHRRTRAIKAKVIRKIRLTLILSLAICDTAFSIYQRYGPANVNTSYLSHFSGAIMGFVVGIMVLKNRKAEYWEKILKGVCLGLSLLMLAGAIYLNVVEVNSYRFDRFETNGTTDYRPWDEALEICQKAMYEKNQRDNGLCKQLNWPSFKCFNTDLCKHFYWPSLKCRVGPNCCVYDMDR